MENKKVRNAKEVVYDNIKFKSTLEERAYKFLKNSNVNFQYEPKTFTLQEGFTPTIPFYEPNGKTVIRKFTKKGIDYKVQSTKYTPDFIVTFPNVIGIIEMKGMIDTQWLKSYLGNTLNQVMTLIEKLHSLE